LSGAGNSISGWPYNFGFGFKRLFALVLALNACLYLSLSNINPVHLVTKLFVQSFK